jgi:NNP family nitrate/nitrite transporter-like MFS transporter
VRQLVIDNVLHEYFSDTFNMDLKAAGLVASYSGLLNVCSRALGGVSSDLAAKRFGMRGRLWTLWFLQTTAGGVCVAFGYATSSLGTSIGTMIVFSFFTQMACGATYGVVPFVSKRALGVVSGFVGGGGNTVAAILQHVFFTNTQVPMHEAFSNLGITTMVFTALIAFVHFPMWGSMFLGPTKDATEEAYYTAAYTAEEKEQGKDGAAKIFARETMGERGSKHGSQSALAAMADAQAAGAEEAALKPKA